jgi:hypothetical protein
MARRPRPLAAVPDPEPIIVRLRPASVRGLSARYLARAAAEDQRRTYLAALLDVAGVQAPEGWQVTFDDDVGTLTIEPPPRPSG